MDLDRVETLCRSFAIGVRLAEQMLRDGKKIQRSNVEVSKEVRDILIACEIGRRFAAKRSVLVMDADKWITVKNGSHVKIDEETGEVKAGLGGKAAGVALSKPVSIRVWRLKAETIVSEGLSLCSKLEKSKIPIQKKDVQKIFRDIAKKLNQHVIVLFEDGEHDVQMSRNTWKEIIETSTKFYGSDSYNKLLKEHGVHSMPDRSPLESLKVAFGIVSKIPDVLDKPDERTAWENPHHKNKNDGSQICTFRKRFEKENVEVLVDILKTPESQKQSHRVYNANSSQNRSMAIRKAKEAEVMNVRLKEMKKNATGQVK